MNLSFSGSRAKTGNNLPGGRPLTERGLSVLSMWLSHSLLGAHCCWAIGPFLPRREAFTLSPVGHTLGLVNEPQCPWRPLQIRDPKLGGSEHQTQPGAFCTLLLLLRLLFFLARTAIGFQEMLQGPHCRKLLTNVKFCTRSDKFALCSPGSQGTRDIEMNRLCGSWQCPPAFWDIGAVNRRWSVPVSECW